MARRGAFLATLLTLFAVLAGLASAGVFVFPASSAVVGAEGSGRSAARLREAPLLYDADPSDVMRADGRMQQKRASNLGSRLMCQLDSRNCGTFNMGKKFGRFSWLRSADSTWRRLQYELGGHRWERGLEAGGGDGWREDDDDDNEGGGPPFGPRGGVKRTMPLQETEPNDELQILRVD